MSLVFWFWIWGVPGAVLFFAGPKLVHRKLPAPEPVEPMVELELAEPVEPVVELATKIAAAAEQAEDRELSAIIARGRLELIACVERDARAATAR